MTRRGRWPAQGFTLVELLIVLVLLSLVVLALASVMRTAAQTEERVDARLQRVDDVRVASGFLRSVLGRASAQRKNPPPPAGDHLYFFQGSPTEARWVGVMPARYGAGGLHHFRLFVTDGQLLVLQYLPWIDAATPPDWAQAPSATLLTNVVSLDMQYQDASDEPPLWTSQWAVLDRLPDRVMVSIQTPTGALPELIVPIRVTPASDSRSRGPVFGGDV